MSWMAKLYETYDHIVDLCQQDEQCGPWPVSHFVKNAHIEVVLDADGNYQKRLTKILDAVDSPTLIPATESSAGRSGAKIAPHPLCDEIGYCAADRPKAKRGKVEAYFDQLGLWVSEDSSNEKLSAIYKYLLGNTLWKDLSESFEFPLKIKKRDGSSQKIIAEKVFVRWRVNSPGNVVTGTWEDQDLIDSWIAFDREFNSTKGLCYITGAKTRSASNHPRFLRRPGDGAKLVSSNDSSGYTFLGRFTDKSGSQAAEVGFDVTQKAHNALRWLIAKQGVKIGQSRKDAGAVVLAWAVSGKEIPLPMEDTVKLLKLVFDEEIEPESIGKTTVNHVIDLGHTFASALRKHMAGYSAKFDATDNVVIMGLDSATPGRMAVTYYQEFFPKQYIEQITCWHEDFAWYQRHKQDNKTIWPISAPAPRAICEAIYGATVSDSLKKNTVERILPCIAEARPFPRDLVSKAVQRASNRNSYKSDEQWQWEKHLGITCSLYRGFCKRKANQPKEYEMTLEENNHSRDYLYGRLLAIAERTEEIALSVAGENRSTTAARMMQRFADRPSTTWRNIELSLQPYIQRLKNNRAGFLHNMQTLLDDVMSKFNGESFNSDKQLSGEFLLAYHSQRLELRKKKSSDTNTDIHELQPEGEE